MSRRTVSSLLSAALLLFPYLWPFIGLGYGDDLWPNPRWLVLLPSGLGAAAAFAIRPPGIAGPTLALLNLLTLAMNGFLIRHFYDWL